MSFICGDNMNTRSNKVAITQDKTINIIFKHKLKETECC